MKGNGKDRIVAPPRPPERTARPERSVLSRAEIAWMKAMVAKNEQVGGLADVEVDLVRELIARGRNS